MDEKRKIMHSLIFPLFFLLLMWLVKIFEITMEFDFAAGGVMPRKISGLVGILFSPLIHDDWKHLFDNSVPILLLGFSLFYFYRGVSYRVFLWIYLFSGIILWVIGREAYHIGASTLVYGLATFLFFSGVLRRITQLMAISLLVVFLYGSLIWGLLPIDYHISWEGHLSGAIVGAFLAVWYRDQGPEREKPSWELEEEDEEMGSLEEAENMGPYSIRDSGFRIERPEKKEKE